MVYKQQTPDEIYKELMTPEKMETGNSREYQSSQGYKFLFVWSNAVLLRILVKKLTDYLGEFTGVYGNLEGKESSPLNSFKPPYSPLKGRDRYLYTPLISRLKAQMDDSARSVVANIEEGFKRPTTKEYLEFIGFSQGSLVEEKGDVERCLQDGYLVSQKGRAVLDLGIDLGEWGRYLRDPANIAKVPEYPLREFRGVYRNLEEKKKTELDSINSLKAPYSPLKESKGVYGNLEESKIKKTLGEITGEDLVFEHFMELINKTDWGLRKLVISLEKKQEDEKTKLIWGE